MCVSLVEGQAERWDITAQGAKKGFDLAVKVRVSDVYCSHATVAATLSIHLTDLCSARLPFSIAPRAPVSIPPGPVARLPDKAEPHWAVVSKSTHTQRHTRSAMRSLLYQYRRRGAPPLDVSVMSAMGALSLEDEAGRTDVAPATPASDAEAQGASGGGQNSNGKSHCCTTCNKGYSSARGLKTHIRQVHELCKYGEAWKPERSVPCILNSQM